MILLRKASLSGQTVLHGTTLNGPQENEMITLEEKIVPL